MEQEVQYVFSIYGVALWAIIALFSSLWWWAWRPINRKAPRWAAARSALLLSLFGVPFLAEGVDLNAQLILLLVIFGSAIVLWRVSGDWPVYLFLACGSFAFLRDGMSLEAFLSSMETPEMLLDILLFRVPPTVDSVFDFFLEPMLHGSSMVLLFRLVTFPLGAWAAVKCLQAVDKEQGEKG